MVYLNNAHTTLVKPPAYYEAQDASLAEAEKKLRDFFVCKNNESIILTEGGRQAVMAACLSLIREGDHIITTDMEHSAVLEALAVLEERGCSVTYIPLNSYGTLRYELIEEAIGEKTAAIVCCHGSHVTGNIVDLERVCTIARRHGLRLIVDGCQSAGAVPVDLHSLSVDAFCFSGHKKLLGPYGSGGICLREGLELTDEARRLVQAPSSKKLGQLCASLDFIKEKGLYGISIFPHRLAKRFFEAVKSMQDVTVYGDFGTNTRVPTVALSVKGFSPQEVKLFLQKRGIAAAAGAFEAPRLMKSFGREQEGVVRFSFGYFNTRQEVNEAVWALMELQGLDDLYLLS